jgi:hypothetical protein
MMFQISMMVLSHRVFHAFKAPVVSKERGRTFVLNLFLVPKGRFSNDISFFLCDLLAKRLVHSDDVE